MNNHFQHHEKKGALLWNLWVKVSLKFLKRSVVPTWPLDLKTKKIVNQSKVFFTKKNIYRSTITTGIWTNCRGLLASFKAWVRFRICPLITLICFSYKCRSKPLSVYRTKKGYKIEKKNQASINWDLWKNE